MVLMKKDGVFKYVADAHIETFRNDGYIIDGEETQGQAEKFACPHCDKEYATQATLDRHIAQKHATNED